MSKVDQFESVFKAAAKTPFSYEDVEIESVLVLTDLEGTEADAFNERVRTFLRILDQNAVVRWKHLGRAASDGIDAVLALIEEESPDLICTYRSLHSQSWRWSYTLGKYVDILAQETSVPVLLLPNPTAEREAPEIFQDGKPGYGDTGTKTVMAMTDHLAGDHHLVSWAVRFTQPGGTLVLTHVEDGQTFARYIDVISKIPSIDTDDAREAILKQLLKEPHDYIRSCSQALLDVRGDLTIEEVVTVGHRLDEYRRLITEHDVDLLILNTKDEDQLAMHGLAYPLVVELRHIPSLLL